ncbi:hypothetical protein QWY14_09000 [Planococcus sp. N028]|uniref:Aerobactin siderophore biosynthesis IucA/IucC-like C-terminal domain-containing protein n=1 Tax=Planococcus shixiaomingii TaxID=3058393 RepID=A0ABT8N212_9BACL|nr:hypothetical protein [Planococcus sp. N028]MDN7241933.1 hypothetical protein [Planococcus sp. N028]
MKELALFQVAVQDGATGFMTVQEGMDSRFPELFSELSQTTEAPNRAVASSIFMRRFGFFITAQLYLLAHGKMWDGKLENVHMVKTPGGISFAVDDQFLRERRDGDLETVLKEYAMPVVEAFRKIGHVSKLILWENIWGYSIWMYGMQDSPQAERDVESLMDAALWQPEMRKSFFHQFLGGCTFSEAKSDYKRITCCLLKEVPGTDKCPYCPMAK